MDRLNVKTIYKQSSYIYLQTENKSLLGMGEHLAKGSPVNPGGQMHVGMWFTTLHCAPVPQVPGQGSTHLNVMHASVCTQSEFCSHSRLQPLRSYGSPSKPGRQEQDAAPFLSLHSAFGPHGDGWQGVTVGMSSVAAICK